MLPLSPSMVTQSLAGDRGARQLRPVGGHVDRHAAASDDAGLSHLARDQRGMGGAGADRRHDAGGDRKARDVGRAGVGAHQDHRVARGRKPLGAFGAERGASDRDAAGCADAGCDRIAGR